MRRGQPSRRIQRETVSGCYCELERIGDGWVITVRFHETLVSSTSDRVLEYEDVAVYDTSLTESGKWVDLISWLQGVIADTRIEIAAALKERLS